MARLILQAEGPGVLKRLLLRWQSWRTRRKMDRVFGRREDPYRYKDSSYERMRLDAMEEAVGPGSIGSALEAGCAEGAFTRRLAGRCRRLWALDLSPVALERARAALQGRPVEFAQADLRHWDPGSAAPFDLVVLGDVLYYMDKPMVRDEFEALFGRVAGWLAPGGRVLLAHGFGGPQERELREGYRRRFEALGLRLVSERVVGEGSDQPDVRCLISLLQRGG